ncbi:MAG: hypothetical protein M0R46_11560 [Candidatus Muirbacterium halophilum]|nr:hypothetical protein [Candidatus Muirbacterium halophilum]
MLVRVKNKAYGLSSKLSKEPAYSVYREDEQHYYVRNNDGMIEGFMKQSFTKTSKREERELKLKRILRECDAVKETKEFSDYDIDNAKIKVEWSGSYPNLCSGEWTIRINEMVIPIPEERIGGSMGTSGEYSRWYFGENYEEHTEHYYDGDDSEWSNDDNWLKYAIWCLSEYHSLRFIGDLDRLYDRIYNEISENDWRSGSCGGCI